MKYFFLLLTVLFFTGINDTRAQRDKDRSFYYDYGQDIYAETYYFPSDNIDSIDVLLLFRLRYNILTFSKMPDKNRKIYYAVPSLTVDYRDSQGIIRFRDNWRDTIYTDNYDLTKSKKDFVIAYINKTLPAAEYKLSIDLANMYNKSVARKSLPKNSAFDFYNSLTVSKPLFIYAHKNNLYKPFVFGGNLNFSSDKSNMVLALSYKAKYDSYNYNIKHETTGPFSPWKENIDISGQEEVVKGKGVRIINSGDGFLLALDKDIKPNKAAYDFGLINISLPPERLVPGRYTLTISPVGVQDTVTYSFKVEWINKPVSLRKPEYAAELMKYILTDDEYEEISDGSKGEILEKIWLYWKKNDPTKFTPYNEAMAEFFTRVDYAFFNFQTFETKDGAKTDRGKIYILKGKPVSIERNLKDGKTIEIWTYDNLKEKYHFETNNTGLYILKEIKRF